MMELISITADYNLNSKEALGVAAAYALGCFTTGYYLVRWRMGMDVRSVGSGNVGATNVQRALGRRGFIFTFLGDFSKGLIAIVIAKILNFGPLALLLVLLAVVAGHNWPIQLSFRGGKGISTSMGALLVYDPLITLGLVIIFLVFYACWHKFTLSGLAAYALAPLIALVCQSERITIAGMLVLTAMVLGSHHQNLREAWSQLKPAEKA